MRRAGVLLHPTALPSGVLDGQVEIFLEWMEQAGLKVWQMLPLGPPHRDRSPYQTYSSHAINPALLPQGLTFSPADAENFEQFKQAQGRWIDSYAMFVVLRRHFGDLSWDKWPDEYKYRNADALAHFAHTYRDEICALQQEQFLLWRRWDEIHHDANARGIEILGDVPIAVAYDSANVWANPQLFKLDEDLNPTVVAGVPPDYFSATGQRWGNPHYNWELMRRDDFAWWRKRMKTALYMFDLVRIDHFRGLVALWEIPAESKDGTQGEWVETPGRELLEVLRRDFPDMPFVAEDLGVITEEVTALRDAFDLPGLSVLQFGFDHSPDNPHSLENQHLNTVVYTGTHDNDTSMGWFESLDQDMQDVVRGKLRRDVGAMPWPLIVAALESCARLAIIPMQDWLGLGSSCRTNTPGTTSGNWNWSFSWDQVPDNLSATIRTFLQQTERLQQ